MKLVITTPISITVDADDVNYVRAEDETGAFGIFPGHADFITTLTVSVITWKNGEDRQHHVAVGGGVLIVREGRFVEVVTREAVGEDTLEALGEAVLERMRAETRQGESYRFASASLEVAALRQLQNYLATGHGRMVQGSPAPAMTARLEE
jgi:F-type H+-transporting ATPase subunit epsilon